MNQTQIKLAFRPQREVKSMSYSLYEQMLKDCRLARSQMQEEFSRERRLRMALETEVKRLTKQLATCKCGVDSEH